MKIFPTRNKHSAFILTTAPRKILANDVRRVGLVLQNHSTNTGIFYASSDGANIDGACLELIVGGVSYEDVLAPNGDLWARSTNAGDVITVIEKY